MAGTSGIWKFWNLKEALFRRVEWKTLIPFSQVTHIATKATKNIISPFDSLLTSKSEDKELK